jgi:hypothetical protein
MNAEGEVAIKEMLELFNNGWHRDGWGNWYADDPSLAIPRHVAIEIQRRVYGTLGVCEEDPNPTQGSLE